jgi:hypothetical protein
MSLLHASIPPFFATLLLTGCVAEDPDLLGDLETGNDGPTSTDDGATSVAESGGPDACVDPAHAYFETPCAANNDGTPILPGAGCYEPCAGPGAACGVGACTQVQVDPCTCVEGEDCCLLCGSMGEWLCVESLPNVACEQIVGTTFASVEELTCGASPEGPIPCHYWITFEENGDFLWVQGDFGQGSQYTCEGGEVTLIGVDADLSFDPATGILTLDDVEYQPDAVCEQIVGTTFASVEELECGLGPDGPVPCHWQITFEEDGDYLWMYSDVGEGGTYACHGNLVISGDVDFAFDTATGILTWDGVEYVAAPA